MIQLQVDQQLAHVFSSLPVIVALTRLLENIVLFDAARLVESAAAGKAHPKVARLILLSLKALFAGCLGFASLFCVSAAFVVFEFFYVLSLILTNSQKERKKEKKIYR
jgi:hypothetical protein